MSDAQRRLLNTLKNVEGAHIRAGMFGATLYVRDQPQRNLRSDTVRALSRAGVLRKLENSNRWVAA